jgi:hypothetical protein
VSSQSLDELTTIALRHIDISDDKVARPIKEVRLSLKEPFLISVGSELQRWEETDSRSRGSEFTRCHLCVWGREPEGVPAVYGRSHKRSCRTSAQERKLEDEIGQCNFCR